MLNHDSVGSHSHYWVHCLLQPWNQNIAEARFCIICSIGQAASNESLKEGLPANTGPKVSSRCLALMGSQFFLFDNIG